MNRWARILGLLLLTASIGATPVLAQNGAADDRDEAQRIEAEAIGAMQEGRLADAEGLFRRQTELEPGNFVPFYNLACVLSRRGRGDEACERLVQAVERGFTDIRVLRTDPDLAGVREHEQYRKLVGNWHAILERIGDLKLAHLQQEYGEGYTYLKDDRLRLVYASGFDETSFEAAKRELTLIAEWADARVFAGLLDAEAMKDDAWVSVVLPTTRDFTEWAVRTFGPGAVTGSQGIGGLYSHDRKSLVAKDLGGTMRHEFFHVLHWRDAVRRGQAHPIWVQEGLASLVEDFDVRPDGTLAPAASWRTNMAKRLERAGRVPDLEQLATMPRDRFSGTRPLANYARARTFFLYLYERGLLRRWYAAFTDAFDADPTGVQAIEKTFGAPIGDVERDYKLWIRELPDVPDYHRPSGTGSASLGVDVSPGTGDGPKINGIDTASQARRAGLRLGDVITAIDGRPTRDIAELMRILSDYEPGETVTVSYRRRSRHGEVRMQLVPKE